MQLQTCEVRGYILPQFSAPASGETIRRMQRRFRDAKIARNKHITMSSLVGGRTARRRDGTKKFAVFYFLSVKFSNAGPLCHKAAGVSL